MTVVNISWYLCAPFAFALAVDSVITVAPGGELVLWLFTGAPAAITTCRDRRFRVCFLLQWRGRQL